MEKERDESGTGGGEGPRSGRRTSALNLFATLPGWDGTVAVLAVDSSTHATYAAGDFRAPGSGLARIGPDRVVDDGFTRKQAFDGAVHAIGIDPARGMVYVGGAFAAYRGLPVRSLLRLDPGGDVDSSFTPALPERPVVALSFDAAEQRLFVALGVAAGQFGARILKLRLDGTPEPGWTPPDVELAARILVRDRARDELYVGGYYPGIHQPSTSVARLRSDGSRDFGYAARVFAGAIAMSLTSERKLVVATPQELTRLLPSGQPDPSFRALLTPLSAMCATAEGALLAVKGSFVMGPGELVRLQGDGSPDPSLGAGHVFDGPVRTLACDGATVLAGGSFDAYDGVSVRRFAAIDASGRLDPRTASPSKLNGKVVTLVRGTSRVIFAGGEFVSYDAVPARWLARFGRSGTFEPMSTTLGPARRGLGTEAILLIADGGLLAAGSFPKPLGSLVRLAADGTVDAAFSRDIDGSVGALAHDRHGRILVGGGFQTYRGQAVPALVRLLPDGSPDPGFQPGLAFRGVNRILVDPSSGKLYVTGSVTEYNELLYRLEEDGRVDASFTATVPTGGARGMALDREGRLLSALFLGYRDSHLVRIELDGRRDDAFRAPRLDRPPAAVAVDPEGRIYVGGEFETVEGAGGAKYLVRLLRDGAYDASFPAGTALNGPVAALAFDEAGRLMLAGSFSSYQGIYTGPVVRLALSGAIAGEEEPAAAP